MPFDRRHVAGRAASGLACAGLLGTLLLPGTLASAGPPPPPDWQPAPPAVVYAPGPAVVYARPIPVAMVLPAPTPPPPLPTALRIVYAPFYVAALTLRYGVYYGIVVPLEVFGRTLAYGFEGGVADREGETKGE